MGFGQVKSDFLKILDERGFINQATDLDGLDQLFASKSISAYIGFDCTAPTLHVGSLVQIMMLRHLQKCGHTPIVLMGGGTTKVGDPSGKTETRQLLSGKEIDANIKGIRTIFDRFLSFGDGQGNATLVNNSDWLDQLDYIPFLRDIGMHFTVNRMLGFDSVKLRLDREQPLTFIEFNYMILQAYDFLELYRRMGCKVQLGGSDQWGNIVSGIELGRRIDGVELYGLTSPLITTSDGEKMGKTEKGAIWLTPGHLSDYDYWQFWRNTQDTDVGGFLKLFTELPLDEIAKLEKLEGQELNEAKKILANVATALCRGADAAKKAAETARKTFEEGAAGADLPSVNMSKKDFGDGVGVLELFVLAGLCSSKKEARRLIQQGGAKIADLALTDETAVIGPDRLGKDGTLKLSAGKKRHALLKIT